MLAEGIEEFIGEAEFEVNFAPELGRGALEPLLGLPALAAPRLEAGQ